MKKYYEFERTLRNEDGFCLVSYKLSCEKNLNTNPSPNPNLHLRNITYALSFENSCQVWYSQHLPCALFTTFGEYTIPYVVYSTPKYEKNKLLPCWTHWKIVFLVCWAFFSLSMLFLTKKNSMTRCAPWRSVDHVSPFWALSLRGVELFVFLMCCSEAVWGKPRNDRERTAQHTRTDCMIFVKFNGWTKSCVVNFTPIFCLYYGL